MEVTAVIVSGPTSSPSTWMPLTKYTFSTQENPVPTQAAWSSPRPAARRGDIIRKTTAKGVTVPLGARPSVGAGLWLQGGIGHLARLACDAVVGAVVVSVDSGRVLYVGRVPRQHRPVGAVRPENEADLLWAMKGAGTNFGIVISVTFTAYPARAFSTRNWVVPLRSSLEARRKLRDFDQVVAGNLPRNCSADAYLYWHSGQLHLGVTMFESSMSELTSAAPTPLPSPIVTVLGPEDNFKLVDSVGLFETEMYKEQHRPALTEFFQGRVLQRSRLPEEQFLNVVYGAADADVLLITGMRDEAPVAAFSHLGPESRLLEVRVTASEKTRRTRRGCHGSDDDDDDDKDSNNVRPDSTVVDYRPSLTFDNDTAGDEAATRFAQQHLLPFFHEDLQRLANKVRAVPGFPRPGIEFRHVLDIVQQPGGLAPCASLLCKSTSPATGPESMRWRAARPAALSLRRRWPRWSVCPCC